MENNKIIDHKLREEMNEIRELELLASWLPPSFKDRHEGLEYFSTTNQKFTHCSLMELDLKDHTGQQIINPRTGLPFYIDPHTKTVNVAFRSGAVKKFASFV